jgi:predicted nucleic-acid-binding protein
VEIAWKALRSYEAGSADFSDALIAQANIGDGCEYTATVDKQAARLPGFDALG